MLIPARQHQRLLVNLPRASGTLRRLTQNVICICARMPGDAIEYTLKANRGVRVVLRGQRVKSLCSGLKPDNRIIQKERVWPGAYYRVMPMRHSSKRTGDLERPSGAVSSCDFLAPEVPNGTLLVARRRH